MGEGASVHVEERGGRGREGGVAPLEPLYQQGGSVYAAPHDLLDGSYVDAPVLTRPPPLNPRESGRAVDVQTPLLGAELVVLREGAENLELLEDGVDAHPFPLSHTFHIFFCCDKMKRDW